MKPTYEELEAEVQRLRDKLAERDAPEWTKHEIVKSRPDEDWYVMWINSADGPGWAGTRAAALAEGVPAVRLRRADATGSSAQHELANNWASTGVVAEQLGWLPRRLIGDYARAAQRSGSRAARAVLRVPFEDAPWADCEPDAVFAADRVITVPRSQWHDANDWLRPYQNVWLRRTDTDPAVRNVATAAAGFILSLTDAAVLVQCYPIAERDRHA